MSHIAIVPAGAWGSALSIVLQDNGHSVVTWELRDDYSKIAGSEYVLLAPPSAVFREVAEHCLEVLPDASYISVTKGIEPGTLYRSSQIIEELRPGIHERFAILSGPSFAEEVAERRPTALTCASNNQAYAEAIQRLFTTSFLRIYTTTDVVGVELGGTLKNIVALAAGISDGVGYGDNARAALITRGFREMLRLAKAEGAQEQTLIGLSGIGDLILTCTSRKSRNYSAGIAIGRADSIDAKAATIEGLTNAQLVLELSERNNLDLFLFAQIARVVSGECTPHDALAEFMSRPLRAED